MSTERTDQYPEVSADDTGLVPPQGVRGEWPKKIRTLTANELDRLTIDGLGRFYWDGKLVNYEAQSSRIDKPLDLDQHAMDLLDRTARELSDPNATQQTATVEAVPAIEPVSETIPTLAASPADQLVPAAAPVAASATVVDVSRRQFRAPIASEVVRVKLTALQSVALVLVIAGFLMGAAGIAVSGFVALQTWGCSVGWSKSYCPPPPPVAKPPARPDIPA